MHTQLAQRIDKRAPIFRMMFRFVFENTFQRHDQMVGGNQITRVAGLIERLDDDIGKPPLWRFGVWVGHLC